MKTPSMPKKGKLVLPVAILALLVTAPLPAASGSGGALVVGDSLQELTSPYLERYLPGVPLTVNAVGGYNSFQIFDLFEQSFEPDRHSVIVFDGGTNDNPAHPEILAGNLAAVARAVGDRCMVVPTIHGLTVSGIGNGGKNRVVAQFAASRPGTRTPDWAGAVAAHPELMQADDLHPVAAGADHRARLIARGIRGCLGFAAAPPREPVQPRPELPPAERMERRQNALTTTIATAAAGRMTASLARRELALAAALAAVALVGAGDA